MMVNSLEHARRPLLTPLALCLSCGCSTPSTADATQESGTTSGPALETESGADTESSETETGMPPPDSNPETGDDEIVAVDLFPLTVGSHWEYEVSQVGVSTPLCPLGQASSMIAEALELDSRSAVRYVSLCGADWFFSVDLDAIDFNRQGEVPPWKRYLDNPVADGHEWTTHLDISLRWASHGTISVPAGDFDNCWRREVVGMMTYAVYCPGVGLVHSYAPEGAYEAVLTSYTLE